MEPNQQYGISNHESLPSEISALLPKPSTRPRPIELSVWKLLSEALVLTRVSIPVILGYILQNSLQTVSVLIAGRLSPEALATAAFSYMFAMSTAWLIALGGTTALDTLASSSFTGSSNKRDLGMLLQRGLIVLSLFYLLVVVVWWYSKPLFQALGQEYFICEQSPIFLRWLIPGGLGYIWFEAMKKFLQAQEIHRPGTYVLLITSPINAVLNYLFIYTLEFGLYGAPLATGISYWLSFLLLLAFLGVIHIGTEWWAFEIVALAAGRLGTTALAAQSVIMTSDQIINTIPFGLGVSTSARVGNLLGARRPRDAARTTHVSAVLSMALGALILAVLMSNKNNFGRIFNGDERVIEAVAEVMPYVALFQIADGLNGSCGGSLRGMGRQWIGASVNILSYYFFALPFGIYLAFHGWGLSGLWMCQCLALYLVGGLEWLIVGLSDWNEECERAIDRIQEESTDSEDRLIAVAV
ncbi:ethionine resistance protein [Conoideocrella luteorostrata]|uniref:Ethionine resistance protein n=1 Tax=Conoideocrella luteorostrata TaxID=1105319 RepID=A0AAJ0FZ97_9HYPO|nr:ethionine resistance protein [Conoideocrella luteorostrata]